MKHRPKGPTEKLQISLRLAGPLVIIGLWQILAVGEFRHFLLPPPLATFQRLGELLLSAEILPDLARTILRWLGGFFLGSLVGIPAGLVMGSSRSAYSFMEVSVDFFRSLPVTALFPVFLILFGIGDASKLAMAFASTVFVVVLNSAYGVLHATDARTRMAHTFGASPAQIFYRVLLPEALPQIAVGMRTTLSLSLIVVVVAEMFLGTRFGLGQLIFDAYAKAAVADLYGIILLLGLIGYSSNVVFRLLESKTIYWAGQ